MEVGQEFVGESGPITRDDISEYAGASGDRNPIHIDEDFATNIAGLNGVIAHGMLSFGYMSKVIDNIIEGAKIIKLGGEMRGMVRPGNTNRTVAKVEEINGKRVKLDIVQTTILPLKIEKDGEIVKEFEGQERGWVRDKDKDSIATKEVDEGTLTYCETLSIKGTAEIELP